MTKPYISKYSNLQANMLNSSWLMGCTVKFYITMWPNSVSKMILKVLMLPAFLIYFCLTVIAWILTLLGYIVNLIFIVRTIYALVFLIICLLSEYISHIMNRTLQEEFLDYITEKDEEVLF